MNTNHNSKKFALFAGILLLGVALFTGTFIFIVQLQKNGDSTTPYVTTENFEEEVLQADVPVLVDFTATWCVPCREVDPIIDELAVEMEGKVKVFKLDIDDSPDIYQEYNINGIPHILFFRNGVEEDRVGGAQAKSTYVDYLDGMIEGKSAFDITIEMLEGDAFRRYFILERDLEVVKTANESVPNLLTQKFENGQTPLSLILNRPSVRQNDLITLTLTFDPEISTHDLVGLGRCDEFLLAIEDDPDAVNRLDPDGNSVLVTAMMRSNRLGEDDCTEVVLSAGVDLSKQNSSNFSLGRAVVLQQNIGVLEKFIELGWDVDLQDDAGHSTLQWAAYYGYIENVLYLLEHGADATLEFPDGRTIEDFVNRSYARSKESLNAMKTNEETDFTEQIKTVKESVQMHEQVLALLKSQVDSETVGAESDTES
ncbi:MAG: thioredoxin [Gammaproteobacteria bacterium]|nr:thioredoxin [Gammaproteobacteria bacterium]MYI77980.1 thioredoxin [Gammaproteobacteria bacterium]